MFRTSTTERIVGEAKDFASQAAHWLEDRVDNVDTDGIKDGIVEGARDAMESAREGMESVAAWLKDFTSTVSIPVPEPEPRFDGKKAVAATVAVGAVGWYFFAPDEGAKRRKRVADYVGGLRDRAQAFFA